MARSTFEKDQAKGTHAKPSTPEEFTPSDTKPFLGASSRERRATGGKPRKPNFITRRVNRWCNRLLGAVSERSLADQEEEYAAHRTTRDYVWNTVGVGAWGMVFPILTVVVTQLVGVEQAGMFSLAFVTGTLLMILANYGVRTYQVSDVRRGAFVLGLPGESLDHLRLHGARRRRLLPGTRLRQARCSPSAWACTCTRWWTAWPTCTKAGCSRWTSCTWRASRRRSARSWCSWRSPSACSSRATWPYRASSWPWPHSPPFAVFTFPLALFETPKSKRWNFGSIVELFRQCFPLFIALFLYAFIDNMPKFVMEGVLSYDNQLYFNALYFPAQGILLTVGFIYKPLLVRWRTCGPTPKSASAST